MTAKEAEALGYRIWLASAIEIGLSKGNQGIRTWFISEFGNKIPSLSHPKIMKAIEIEETPFK